MQIESLYNDSRKYSNVQVSELKLTESSGNTKMTIQLCLVVKSDVDYIEDVFIKMVKTGFLFSMQVEKDSGEFKVIG